MFGYMEHDFRIRHSMTCIDAGLALFSGILQHSKTDKSQFKKVSQGQNYDDLQVFGGYGIQVALVIIP